LSAYADGTLDEAEREIAESHLADCRGCRAEAQDLLDFKEAAAPASSKKPNANSRPSPAPTPAPTWRANSCKTFGRRKESDG
jgi:anti-sigma factor RsiW